MRRRAAAAVSVPAGATFGGGGRDALPPAGLAGIPGREGKLEGKPIQTAAGIFHVTLPSVPPPKPRYTARM
jgi:hypothetical protein